MGLGTIIILVLSFLLSVFVVRFDFDIKTARNLLIFGSASFILAGLLTQWCIEYTDLTCTEGNELVDLSKGYKKYVFTEN
jgi:hypothetical protein